MDKASVRVCLAELVTCTSVSEERVLREDSDEFVDADDDIRHFERSESSELAEAPSEDESSARRWLKRAFTDANEEQETDKKRVLEVVLPARVVVVFFWWMPMLLWAARTFVAVTAMSVCWKCAQDGGAGESAGP
eukprot:660441-Hanusia_phi.AAC.3